MPSSFFLWAFTAVASPTWSEDSVQETLREHCKKFVFQLELEGEGEAVREVYRGRISLSTKRASGAAVIRSLGVDAASWTLESGTFEAATDEIFYALSDEARVAGPWCDRIVYLPKQLQGKLDNLFLWQQRVYEREL